MLRSWYYPLDFYEPPITACLGVGQVCSKVGVGWIGGNLSLFRGYILFGSTFETWLPATHNYGV